jgi:hypothetical protein
MRAPLLPPLNQTRFLQRRLHPRVAVVNVMHLGQLLVKVPHVEVVILLPIQTQHFLKLLDGHSLRARLSLAVVPQPAVAVLLVPLAPPPHRPVRDADDRSLPPLQLASHRFQDNFLNLHHPLRFRDQDLLVSFHANQRVAPAAQADIC